MNVLPLDEGINLAFVQVAHSPALSGNPVVTVASSHLVTFP